MTFWMVIGVALIIALALAWRSDRRRRGSRVDDSGTAAAKGKALGEGYSPPQNARGFPPNS